MISIIVAKSLNNVIGIQNKIPWNLSEDLKRFKKITSNHTVIMGRKTYESIGKPLPNRLNIIISKNNKKKFTGDNIIVVDSLSKALLKSPSDKEIFIIGGGQIYSEAISKNIPDQLIITEVLQSYDGDAFFPEINEKIYKLIDSSDILTTENNLQYQYKTYQKF